jgi:1,4-dihydroxy-2-naphthoyl-CoA hydrolase
MFVTQTKIRLHDTDAAGIIFFANQFKIIHDAYEDLLEKFDCSFRKMLGGTDLFLPIVHAEADYLAPVRVGDKIAIGITVGHVGKTSFSFEYTLKRGKILVGKARTVHVTVSQKTRKKIPLPAALRKKLSQYHSAAG